VWCSRPIFISRTFVDRQAERYYLRTSAARARHAAKFYCFFKPQT